MNPQTVLVIDDEPDIRELLEITLGRMGLDTEAAEDYSGAVRMLADRRYDLCLTDMRLPDGNGIDLVAHIQKHHPDLPVAVITAHGNMESAVAALKAGAFDFVSKPVDLNNLRNLVTTSLKLGSSKLAAAPADSATDLIGRSEAMDQLRRTIRKLARSQAPVCIQGESGTGKELVAQSIHRQGPRADAEFVPVNCGAIPGELMESEFFGHKKGSFTGAVSDKIGLFQAADGGTLFLDEVAELPLHMQVKLLRAIQEKAIRPVGAQVEVPVNVRILSASHKDLGAEVEAGRFRQDLYYRINVITLKVPPLRERGDDVIELGRFILDRLYADYGFAVGDEQAPQLAAAATLALQRYSFPGNVRELENVLERALTLSEDNVITEDDLRLPQDSVDTAVVTEPATLDEKLSSQEREALVAALDKTRWNKTAAAELLGMSYRQLRYRLKKLEID